jgi:hypothetical protein
MDWTLTAPPRRTGGSDQSLSVGMVSGLLRVLPGPQSGGTPVGLPPESEPLPVVRDLDDHLLLRCTFPVLTPLCVVWG